MLTSEEKILATLNQLQAEVAQLRAENTNLNNQVQQLKNEPTHSATLPASTTQVANSSLSISTNRRRLLKHFGAATVGVMAATALSASSVAQAENTARNAVTGTGGQDGYGGKFGISTGGLAQLYIKPSALTSAPNAGVHQKGEVHVDTNGTLWYCTTDGTPGSWKALSNGLTLQTSHQLPTSFESTTIKAPVTADTVKKPVFQVLQATDATMASSSVPPLPQGVSRVGILSAVERPASDASGGAVIGVYGRAYNSGGTGVYGTADGTGVSGFETGNSTVGAGVWGGSLTGRGVDAWGQDGLNSYGFRYAARLTIPNTGSGHLLFSNSSVLGIPPAEANKTQYAGTLYADSESTLWYCVATGPVGGLGTWRKLVGKSPAATSETYTVGTLHLFKALDRFLDSRDTNSDPNANISLGLPNQLSNTGSDYTITLNPTKPGLYGRYIPAGATAIVANITTTNVTVASGLRVTSGDVTPNPSPGVYTTPGLIFAAAGATTTTIGNIILPLNASRQIKFWTNGQMSVIMDVCGYYM